MKDGKFHLHGRSGAITSLVFDLPPPPSSSLFQTSGNELDLPEDRGQPQAATWPLVTAELKVDSKAQTTSCFLLCRNAQRGLSLIPRLASA